MIIVLTTGDWQKATFAAVVAMWFDHQGDYFARRYSEEMHKH